MATAPATVVRNSSKRFHQFEILGPAISKQAGTSTKNAKSNVNKSPKKQSIQTIYNFVNKATGANQGSRTPMPSHLEEAYRRYEAFASGRKYSEINDYYNKTGKSAYTIENGRVVRNPSFTRDQDYYTYKAPYRDKEPDKYTQENWWGYGTKEKYLKGKKSPMYSQINYWEEGTPQSDMWHQYHNYRDPNWERDEKMLSKMSKEDADTWRQQHWSHDKLYANEAEFRADQAKERRNAEQRYFSKRDYINSRTPEEQQQYHDENYETHHNKRNILDRMFAPLMNNTAAQVTYAALVGEDKSDAVLKSLKYMLPWTDDVSDRKYWSDVIQYVNENLPENATSTESATPLAIGGFKHKTKDEIVNDKFSTAVMGLGLDVAADPLTYLTGGFSAGAKFLKGTGATGKELRTAAKVLDSGNNFANSESAQILQKAQQRGFYKQATRELLNENSALAMNPKQLRDLATKRADDIAEQVANSRKAKQEVNIDYLADSITIDDAKQVLLDTTPSLANSPERLEKMAYELMQNYGRKIYGLRGANEGKGVSIFGKELLSAQKIRSAGDKTIAPIFNVANRKLRSTLGLAFSDNNKLLRFADKTIKSGEKEAGAKAFSSVYARLLADRFGIADKNIRAGYMADQIEEFFANASDEQIMDFIIQHDKGTYRNLFNYEKSFDDIREKATNALKEKNPELAEKVKSREDSLSTLDRLTNSMYGKLSKEMELRRYKNFSQVLDRREQQLNKMIEARDAGIEVEGIEHLQNQINYLKQNQDLVNRHYKDIYQIYGKPITSLTSEETHNALGLMKDLEDIASMSGGEIPWKNLLSNYSRTTAGRNSQYASREFRNKIIEQYGSNDLSSFLSHDIDADKFAEVARRFRDNLFDKEIAYPNRHNYALWNTVKNMTIDNVDSYPDLERYVWKNLHERELLSPVHYDINKVSQLLDRKEYNSAYKNLESELTKANQEHGQAVLDEMKSIMQDKYSLSANQVDDMMALYENQDYRKMHELLNEGMATIAEEEVVAGKLKKEASDKLFGKYIPREISESAKQYWDKLFGEPFESYIKQPGKFNPVHGEKMTYNQQRTFKTMEEGENWYKKQIEKKFVRENILKGLPDKDVENFIKSHDMSQYEELNEMKKVAGKLYNYNIAEIFMNRVIGHNELMQSDAINNLVKARLSDVYTGKKTSDKIVIPYIDMMQDCRRIAGQGDFAGFNSGQEVFDQLVSSVGLDPRLVGKNISHFEVTPKQLDGIQNKIRTTLNSMTEGKSKIKMSTQGYNMDNAIYNMLNRYTKEQMKIMQSSFLNFYDTFLTKIKVLNTIINPGFHGQNAPSNMFQSFLGIGEDAFNASRLKQAFNIIRTGDPKQTITLDGKTYTYRQMRRIFEEYGVVDNTFYNDFKYTQEGSNLNESQLRDVSMQDFNNFFKNDFNGKLSFLNPIADIANKPFKVMGLLGASIEGTQRANLFMSCVDKGYNFREAVEMTNKFLFDYGDLTSQEQQIFKRIIPFYSFLRKNVPMELEMMLEQPYKFVNTQRTFDTISRMSDDYIPPDERNEYRDTDIQLPFRVGGEYYGVSNNMPYTQFEKWTDINKAIGQTSPLLKAIPELLMGEYAYTGMDIDSVPSYIFNQAPIGKVPDRLVHDKNFGTNPRDAKSDYEPDITRRNMWLLGQGIGFPINQIRRQEYKKDGVDIFEEYENDPGMLLDLINAIRARELPENSILNR